MKNVELKTKKDENLKGKVFTKNDVKGIIKRNYNPLNESEGFYMKEIERELNLKERIIVKLFSKTFNKISNLIRINTFNKMIK